MPKKRIVGVVGLGHVGAHVAYTLGVTGTADLVKLCDINEKKLVSEHQDAHGCGHVHVPIMSSMPWLPMKNWRLRYHHQCHWEN